MQTQYMCCTFKCCLGVEKFFVVFFKRIYVISSYVVKKKQLNY